MTIPEHDEHQSTGSGCAVSAVVLVVALAMTLAACWLGMWWAS